MKNSLFIIISLTLMLSCTDEVSRFTDTEKEFDSKYPAGSLNENQIKELTEELLELPEFMAMWESKYDYFYYRKTIMSDHIQSMSVEEKMMAKSQLDAYDSIKDASVANNYLTGLNEKFSENEILAHKDSVRKTHEREFRKAFAENYKHIDFSSYKAAYMKATSLLLENEISNSKKKK